MHAIETRFSAEREVIWKGIGNILDHAPTNLDEALVAAGLTWKVQKEPAYDKRGRVVEGLNLTVRNTDNAILGSVGDVYSIVQPRDAFEFTEALLGKGVAYETAGSLFGGRKIWVLARLPVENVLGDMVMPYLCFSTSFDGTSATKVSTMLTRVECNNTLTFGEANAHRQWSARHSGNIKDKLETAATTLELTQKYIEAFRAKAERYAEVKVSKADFEHIVDEVFGVEDLMTSRQKANALHLKGQLGVALRQADLANFKGTAWHLYNAFGDFASHIDPVRKTANWKESLFDSFIDGNRTLLKVEQLIDELVKVA